MSYTFWLLIIMAIVAFFLIKRLEWRHRCAKRRNSYLKAQEARNDSARLARTFDRVNFDQSKPIEADRKAHIQQIARTPRV